MLQRPCVRATKQTTIQMQPSCLVPIGFTIGSCARQEDKDMQAHGGKDRKIVDPKLEVRQQQLLAFEPGTSTAQSFDDTVHQQRCFCKAGFL